MTQMTLKGPLVVLLDNASQQVQGLEAEIARLSARRDDLNRAMEGAIREAVKQREYTLPERWEAQPSADGLVVSWDDDELPI